MNVTFYYVHTKVSFFGLSDGWCSVYKHIYMGLQFSLTGLIRLYVSREE